MASDDSKATPRVLGLTGPIACGKTTVGTMLLDLGALARIDADEVVHELMAAGTETTRLIGAAFGDDVIAPNGAVDRKALGNRVFAAPEALERLESIVHPAVRPAVRTKLAHHAHRPGVVILDAVKLLQSDLAELCTAIWLVQCDRREEFRRLTQERSLTPEAARARLDAQPSFDDPRVTAVIDNSGRLEQTRAQVERQWQEFTGGVTA